MAITLQDIYQIARQAGLDDEGARVAVAIAQTEGGLTGNVGDQSLPGGGSYGPFQFYKKYGMLPGFAAALKTDEDTAGQYAIEHPDQAAAWALRGYLGQAIKAGQKQNLHGAELATYAQATGQRSESPERAGANYNALFGAGSGGGKVQMAPQTQATDPSEYTDGETTTGKTTDGQQYHEFARRYADGRVVVFRAFWEGPTAGKWVKDDEYIDKDKQKAWQDTKDAEEKAAKEKASDAAKQKPPTTPPPPRLPADAPMPSRQYEQDLIGEYAAADDGRRQKILAQLNTLYDDYKGSPSSTRPSTVSASSGQPFIVVQNPDGSFGQVPNPNYQDPAKEPMTAYQSAATQNAQDKLAFDKWVQQLQLGVQQGRLDFDTAKEQFDQGMANYTFRSNRQQMAGGLMDQAQGRVLQAAPWAMPADQDHFPGFGAGGPADQTSRLLGAKFDPPKPQPIWFDPRGDLDAILKGKYDWPAIPGTVQSGQYNINAGPPPPSLPMPGRPAPSGGPTIPNIPAPPDQSGTPSGDYEFPTPQDVAPPPLSTGTPTPPEPYAMGGGGSAMNLPMPGTPPQMNLASLPMPPQQASPNLTNLPMPGQPARLPGESEEDYMRRIGRMAMVA